MIEWAICFVLFTICLWYAFQAFLDSSDTESIRINFYKFGEKRWLLYAALSQSMLQIVLCPLLFNEEDQRHSGVILIIALLYAALEIFVAKCAMSSLLSAVSEFKLHSLNSASMKCVDKVFHHWNEYRTKHYFKSLLLGCLIFVHFLLNLIVQPRNIFFLLTLLVFVVLVSVMFDSSQSMRTLSHLMFDNYKKTKRLCSKQLKKESRKHAKDHSKQASEIGEIPHSNDALCLILLDLKTDWKRSQRKGAMLQTFSNACVAYLCFMVLVFGVVLTLYGASSQNQFAFGAAAKEINLGTLIERNFIRIHHFVIVVCLLKPDFLRSRLFRLTKNLDPWNDESLGFVKCPQCRVFCCLRSAGSVSKGKRRVRNHHSNQKRKSSDQKKSKKKRKKQRIRTYHSPEHNQRANEDPGERPSLHRRSYSESQSESESISISMEPSQSDCSDESGSVSSGHRIIDVSDIEFADL